jgi:PIN domain-containing protein
MLRDRELPFCVFLDTEVYRAASFDWTRDNFSSLRERVARGSIELVTTEVVVREMKRGIRALLNEFDQHVQKVAREANIVQVLEDDRVTALRQLAAHKLQPEKLWASAAAFLDETSTTVLTMPDTAFRDLFDLYFDGHPPFGGGKGKKHEFPDAANLLALQTHARNTGRPIYVVSGDGDWSRVCSQHPALIHVKHLSEMLDRAIRAEWQSDDLWSDEDLLKLVLDQEDKLTKMLESALSYASTVNLGDGAIDDLTLDGLFAHGLAITDIHSGEDRMTFRGELFHFVDYSANVHIEDDEMNNTLEDELSGQAELVAKITLELPLDDPKRVDIIDVNYRDGLSLHIPLKY